MATKVAARTSPVIPTGTWTVDPAHSTVGFSVKHMGIANVRGKFTEFEGTLEMQASLADCRAHGSVQVASIDTDEAQRDEHLRSPDFFDAGQFPEITFEVLIQGTDIDPWGNTRAGLEVVAALKRSDFDMKFNQALGSGNVLVGDKVAMALDISAVLQAP